MNAQRGAVKIKGPEGKEYSLCLTLGAVAQMEEDLGIDSLAEVGDVLGNMGARQLMAIMVALLNGGGHTEITKADMMVWPMNLNEMSKKMLEAFKAAGLTDEETDDNQDNQDNEGN